MALHHAFDNAQADAGACKIDRRVQPLEGAEQLARGGHVKARAVVPDEKHLLATAVGLAAKGDVGGVPLAGELPGVAQQVLQHGVEQHGVALGVQRGLDVQRGVAQRIAFLAPLQHPVGQCGQVHVAQLQRALRHLCQRQQPVDQLDHLSRGTANARQVVLALVAQALAFCLGQQVNKPVDGVERRAQVVGHRVRKRFQLAVDCLQLSGAAEHPRFQVSVQPQDLLPRLLALGFPQALAVQQLVGNGPGLGDVVGHGNHMGGLAVSVTHQRHLGPHPHSVAIFFDVALFVGEGVELTGQQARAHRTVAVLVVRVRQGACVHHLQLVQGVAQRGAVGRVGHQQVAARRVHHQARRRRAKQQLHQLLAELEFLLYQPTAAHLVAQLPRFEPHAPLDLPVPGQHQRHHQQQRTTRPGQRAQQATGVLRRCFVNPALKAVLGGHQALGRQHAGNVVKARCAHVPNVHHIGQHVRLHFIRFLQERLMRQAALHHPGLLQDHVGYLGRVAQRVVPALE